MTWGNRPLEAIDRYSELCKLKLKYIDFPQEFNGCADGMCNDLKHRLIIDSFYKNIVNSLCEASRESYSKKKLGKGKCVMGWNKHVAQAHKQARIDYEIYVLHGKPSNGFYYKKMSISRKFFKSRLKFCVNNQEQLKMDKLTSQHSNKDFNDFWKSTKKLDGGTTLPANVEGVSSPKRNSKCV